MKLTFHIKIYLLYAISLACCSSALARQDSNPNPLLGMIGKEYSHYFDRYETLCDSLFTGDSLARVKLVRLFTEAAAADPTGEWELDHRRLAANVRFYDSRKGGFIPSADYTAEQFAEDLLSIARAAEKKGFHYLYLRSLFNAGDAYRIFAENYEEAFTCYLEVAAGLDSLSQREFPWKLYMYREIANFYYSFREYKDAQVFYRKIAEDPEVTCKNNHRLYPALYGLAMCYRHAEQYERSDSCFLRIMELSAPIEEDRYVWEGIAGGSIGYNYYLRGNMEKALSWMKPALARMKRPNDDSFTSQLAANIADIYLRRNDLRNGKKYLDAALYYHRRTLIPEKTSHLLGVMARYHSLRGNRTESAIYLDSTLRMKEHEQEAFSGLVLRRVEQQLRAADRKMHKQKLGAEKMRSLFYKRTAFWVSTALAVILVLLVLLGIYHRRTRRAYHELVLRSQQWAQVDIPQENASEEDPECADSDQPAVTLPPDSADRIIIGQIEQLMKEKKLYTNSELSLDMLASELGLDRRHVSGAINACSQKNFYPYLNEYRVKEAIRIMSEDSNKKLTIDAIAYDCGFNDRRTFHRNFKQFTGLAPSAFRDSM